MVIVLLSRCRDITTRSFFDINLDNEILDRLQPGGIIEVLHHEHQDDTIPTVESVEAVL